jgi:hypothetical protein
MPAADFEQSASTSKLASTFRFWSYCNDDKWAIEEQKRRDGSGQDAFANSVTFGNRRTAFSTLEVCLAGK